MVKVKLECGVGYFNIGLVCKMSNYNLHIHSMTYESGLPERSYMNRTQVGYSLRFFPSGRGSIIIEDAIYPVSPGTFFFMGPRVRYGEISDTKEPMSEYHIAFEIQLSKRKSQPKDILVFQQEEQMLLDPLFNSRYMVHKCEDIKESCDILGYILNELDLQEPGYITKLGHMYPQVFINAARVLNNKLDNSYTVPFMPLTVYKGYAISDTIRDNITEITLETLADKLKISSRQLQRDIRKHFGMSFKELLTFIRMECAKKMLVRTDLTIPDISRAVGMNSISYFYKIFQKHEKITPNAYRKNNKNKFTLNINIKK